MGRVARVEDFRSNRSESREGLGLAKSRRDEAIKRLERTGLLARPPKALPGYVLSEVPGALEFWLLWHLHGGFDGLVAAGMSEATIWRKVKAFRSALGEHPDEFRPAGVTVDVEAFIREYAHDLHEPPYDDEDWDDPSK